MGGPRKRQTNPQVIVQNALRYYQAGELRRAEMLFREAVKEDPQNFEAHYSLASLLHDTGRYEDAVRHYQTASEINPTFAGTYYNIGALLWEQGRAGESLSSYQKALALDPDCADIHNSIGAIVQSQGKLEEAAGHYRKAIDTDPRFAMAYYNLGNVYVHQGKPGDAEPCFRRSLELDPDRIKPYQSLLMLLNYSDRHDAQTIFSEHLNFSRQFEEPLRIGIVSHANKKVSDRRLKIGYVSPDFRRHSVNYFIEQVLASHNHEQFEVFCYSDVPRADDVTLRLRGYADQWRDITGMPDGQAAEQIRRDEIDILIDLAGHTGYNRMLLFARKPAPVQVSWLGYPNTTGLKTMDYRIVDGYTDPPGLTDPFYTERLIRLPESFLCYRPDDNSPEIRDLPAVAAGHITFGSFNFFPKISPTTAALWAEILKALPGSRLVLKAKSFSDNTACDSAHGLFRAHGIAPERIDLLSQKESFIEHLDTYNRIDIGLDTFPYNGTTTTCEALWMGVPVITREGTSHVSRVGMSILSTIGLPGLAAQSADGYIAVAVGLAGDLAQLQSLRGTLRERMMRSPLTDAKQFIGNLENVYREMWEKWCTQ